MDVLDGVYVNAEGKTSIFSKIGKGFVKKDESGKAKLTTGGKIAAGALAIGLTALTASKLKKKPGQAIEENTEDTEQPLAAVGVATQASPAPKKNNTMLYVGIGVGVLAIVGIIIYTSKKN